MAITSFHHPINNNSTNNSSIIVPFNRPIHFHSASSHSLLMPSFFCLLLLLAIICSQIFVHAEADQPKMNKNNEEKVVDELWEVGERTKRAARRLNSGSGEGGGYPYRNRYYVSRWDRRRFVPLVSASREEQSTNNVILNATLGNEQNEPQRLCGIKLTHRTRELCGECAPANMRRVELMDKKSDKIIETREKLTEMCCTKRCTDDQIRNYCCRG